MVDFLLQLPPVQQRRPRSYPFNANLLNYTDEELQARYRFGRESIEYTTNLTEADLTEKHLPIGDKRVGSVQPQNRYPKRHEESTLLAQLIALQVSLWSQSSERKSKTAPIVG